jgi:hypothetical protein
MKVNLETWEFDYNEAHDEIRLFVNGYSHDAVIFSLNKTTITSFLETIDRPEAHKVTLTAQPMVPQRYTESNNRRENWDFFSEDGAFNYGISQDDLSEFHQGPKRAVTLYFDRNDVAYLSKMLWDFWATDHLLLEAS